MQHKDVSTKILIITSILFLVLVLLSSGLYSVRGSTIVTAAAVITLMFLPLIASINNGALFQSQSAFAQQQEGGEVIEDIFGDNQQQGDGNQTGGGPLAGLLDGGQQPSGGQQQGESAFLPYVNPIHGIFMQYPSNWTASTSGLTDYTDVIAFYSPLQNLSDIFPARLTISVITYSQNVSLPEYTNSVQTMFNQSEQVVDVRSSSEVTIASYPGHRVVLALQPFQNSTLIFYQMNTWTTIGNKVYLLTYEAGEPMFNQHLPAVSQMLETLRITSNNMTTTITAE